MKYVRLSLDYCKLLRFLLVLILCSSCCNHKDRIPQKEISPIPEVFRKFIPERFYIDDDWGRTIVNGERVIFEYDPSWKEYELFYRKNIDKDPQLEVIIQFIAVEKWKSKEKQEEKYGMTRAIAFIIDNDKKYLLGLSQYPDDNRHRIDFLDLDNDGDLEMVFYSRSGMHYKEIGIYDYKPQKGLIELFKNGTCGRLDFNIEKGTPTIRICRPDFNRGTCMVDAVQKCRTNIYQWDKNKNKFLFNPSLSTMREITFDEEFQEAADFIDEKIDEFLKNKSSK